MRPWIALLIGLALVWGSSPAFANPMKKVRHLMATPGGHVFLHLEDGKLIHARVEKDALTKPRQIAYLPGVLMASMTHDGYLYYVTRDGTLWLRRYDRSKGRFTTDEAREVGTGWDMFTHIAAGKGGYVYAVGLDGRLVARRHKGRRRGTARWARAEVTLGSEWIVASLHERKRGELFAYGDDARVYRLENAKKPGSGWAEEGGKNLGRHAGYAHVAAVGDEMYLLQHNGTLEAARESEWRVGQKRRLDTTALTRHENLDHCAHMSKQIAACALAVKTSYDNEEYKIGFFSIKNWLEKYSGEAALTPQLFERRCEARLGAPLRPGPCAQQCDGAWNGLTQERCMQCVHEGHVMYMAIPGNEKIQSAVWEGMVYQCPDDHHVFGPKDEGSCLSP